MLNSLARRIAAPAAVAVFALAAASSGHAAPQAVVGGNLNWSTVKLWNATGTVPVTDRTFVGFETRNSGSGNQNMTLAPALGGPAWGTTVSPASPQGAEVSWNFPAIGGIYDSETKTGTVTMLGQLRGVSTFISSSPPIGFDYTLTITDPVVVFDGTSTAHLYANGTKWNGATAAENSVAYERAELFSLDLSRVTETQNADGTTTLSNLVPTVVTDIYGGFPAGAGPDRTPNTFGGFSLTIATPQTGPKGDTGAPGPVGPIGVAGPAGKTGSTGKTGKTGSTGKAGKNGANGQNGANGKSVTRVIARLAKAPWMGSKTRKVSLLKGKSVVATGSLKRKTLTVTVAKGKKVSAGRYTVRLQGSKAKKSIRIG